MKKLNRIYNFLLRENLHKLLLILLVLIIISTAGMLLFEPKVTLPNALWWSIVTLTTVGYGDIAPTTMGGRVIGIIIMFFGIGILGMFTATIASIFVERKLKEDRGMGAFDLENHVIICEWNFRAKEILKELRADPREESTPIVLIAETEHKPVNDESLFFIQGAVNEENLNRANVAKAKTVVILGDDRLEDNARDAKVVLSTLTVESMNRDAYTIVELVDGKNVRHCQRAHADEIIVSSEFSSRLISRATLDHGITRVLSELLSSQYGNDLYKITVKPEMVGEEFLEVFSEMKRSKHSTVVAVQKGAEGEVISNPPMDYRLEKDDFLILIAPENPK